MGRGHSTGTLKRSSCLSVLGPERASSEPGSELSVAGVSVARTALGLQRGAALDSRLQTHSPLWSRREGMPGRLQGLPGYWASYSRWEGVGPGEALPQ